MRLEKFYKERGQELAGYIYRHISDKSIVEDIVQDVFVSLCREPYVSMFEEMTEVEASRYVYRCIENRIVDYYRKEERKSTVLIDDMDSLSKGELQVNFEDSSIDKIIVSDFIRAVFQRLSEDEIALFKAAYYEQLPRRDLAKQYGTTEVNLNMRIYRMKKKVNQIIKDLGVDIYGN